MIEQFLILSATYIAVCAIVLYVASRILPLQLAIADWSGPYWQKRWERKLTPTINGCPIVLRPSGS